MSRIGKTGVLLGLSLGIVFLSGCVTATQSKPIETIAKHDSIHRIIVFVPTKKVEPHFTAGYAYLNANSSETMQKCGVTVVDRTMSTREEIEFQHRSQVSDTTLVSLGKTLGADSILTYQITGPSRYEQQQLSMYYRSTSGNYPRPTVPPVTILAKIINVETSELLWNHIEVFDFSPRTFDFKGMFDNNKRDVGAAVMKTSQVMLEALQSAFGQGCRLIQRR